MAGTMKKYRIGAQCRQKPRYQKDGEEHSIDVRFDFVCPFCRRQASAGYSDDGTPVVLHETPPCETYIELDLPEYLKACREKMENNVRN
jgi:hypothetical protein